MVKTIQKRRNTLRTNWSYNVTGDILKIKQTMLLRADS